MSRHNRNYDSEAPEYIDTRDAPEAIHPYKPPYSQEPYLQAKAKASNYGSPAEESRYPEKFEERRRIAGLPTLGFWVLIAVSGLVLIGACVGGAVGGSISARNRECAALATTATLSPLAATGSNTGPPPSTSTPTTSTSTQSSSTSSAALQATYTDAADTLYTWGTSDCPDSDGQLYTPLNYYRESGDYMFTKRCGRDIQGNDITAAFVQSLDLCINMCESWNLYRPESAKCVAAIFMPVSSPPGNCWIKNSTSGISSSDQTDAAILNDS